MEDVLLLVTILFRLALVLLIGYAVAWSARRWPWLTLVLLLVLIAAGTAAVRYAMHIGYSVDPTSRRTQFAAPAARWFFGIGGLLLLFGVPALPLIVVARARNGAVRGPVGRQWVALCFSYFVACAIWGMVLYSWLTGIVK